MNLLNNAKRESLKKSTIIFSAYSCLFLKYYKRKVTFSLLIFLFIQIFYINSISAVEANPRFEVGIFQNNPVVFQNDRGEPKGLSDTGLGIAVEERESIFMPFIQGKTRQNDSVGTGLGLAISNKYIRLMGGDSTVESQMGRGSVFRFSVQVEPGEIEEIEKSRSSHRIVGLASSQLAPDGGPYRILIAEDIDSNRFLMRQLLQAVGFTVSEAVNGREAIELFESWHPHMIWMDMRMPVMDGFEATKRIKKTAAGQRTPVIALTAHAFEEDRQEILATGCDDFIRKPFRDTDIYEAMAKYLGVKFLFDEKAPANGNKAPVQFRRALTPEVLTGLPQHLLGQLKSSVLDLDMKRINELIEQINSCDSSVAGMFQELADEYKFDEIVEAIKVSTKVRGDENG